MLNLQHHISLSIDVCNHADGWCGVEQARLNAARERETHTIKLTYVRTYIKRMYTVDRATIERYVHLYIYSSSSIYIRSVIYDFTVREKRWAERERER